MSHQYLIDALHPNVKKYMEENELNYRDLDAELRNFKHLPDDGKIGITHFRILLRTDAATITRWKLDGTLPRPDAYGKWTVRQVREVLKNRINKGAKTA